MRRERGAAAWHRGAAAEVCVERVYERDGCAIAARRWRGRGGEIDLVARDGAGVIFIEVKAGRTHAAAAARLGERQMARIFAAAAEYLAGEPLGQLTPARFDVALVDGQGRVEILENAFAA
ncbi:MAG: YraN family protein [Gemmobacter sp.]|jgi:putative endonuclease|nr:YraN family protein [Gemmobacter sp.]